MSESVSSIKRIKQAMGNDHARFVTAFVSTGMLVVIIPALSHAVRMVKYRNSYYYAYKRQENDGGGMTDMNNCKWFNPFCTSVWVNENGEYMDNEDNNNYDNQVPSWFSGWGDANSHDSENTANSGPVKFVYAWQLLMFLGLLAYGSLTIYKYRGNLAQSRVALNSLSLLIAIFGNFSFLIMWLLANGSIFSSDRDLEDLGGFYHQFSVMVFVTNFWYVIWSIGFGIAVARRVSKVQDSESDEMGYLSYSEPSKPEVAVSGV